MWRMNRFMPIYSRTIKLVTSKRRGVGGQEGEGLHLLPFANRLKKRRSKKLQKGGRISKEVSKPPGYDLRLFSQKRSKRRRR